jgi:hypothetical protein
MDEKTVLKIAAEHEGLVTASEVVMNSELSIDESTELLEQMREKGLAALRVADNGTYVYEFTSLMDRKRKKESERV